MASPTAPNRDARIRLLLVKLKNIGDALVVTPTLMAIRASYPNAEIWLVVRKGTEGILKGCSAMDRLLTVAPPEISNRTMNNHLEDLRTWLEIRRKKFDYAFELTDGDRGKWLAGLSGARHRCVNISRYPLNLWWRCWFNQTSDSEWRSRHRVLKDFNAVGDFLPLAGETPPLCFNHDNTALPDILDGLGDFVVFHPGTRWVKKRWVREHWIELGRKMLGRTRQIIVSSGPDEDEKALAAELVAALGPDRVISTDGKLSWEQLAACLHRARVFVGVDTAAMHLAAACQCPLVAIFGFSIVAQWRPWKAPHELINLAKGKDRNEWPAHRIMKEQTPDMVFAAVERLIRPIPSIN
jgi:heptosyltransferase-3